MVIQRWQSIFLLIVAAVMACFTFCSLGQVQLPDYSLNFTTLGFSIEGESTGDAPVGYIVRTWPFFIVSLLSFIIPFINIFMFKNMKLQKTLCLIELLFIMALVAIGAGYAYCQFDYASVSLSSIVVAPLLAFVADVMAYNRISHDQRLLRAADRLR